MGHICVYRASWKGHSLFTQSGIGQGMFIGLIPAQPDPSITTRSRPFAGGSTAVTNVRREVDSVSTLSTRILTLCSGRILSLKIHDGARVPSCSKIECRCPKLLIVGPMDATATSHPCPFALRGSGGSRMRRRLTLVLTSGSRSASYTFRPLAAEGEQRHGNLISCQSFM